MFPTILIAVALVIEYYYQNPLFALWVAYAIIPILDHLIPHDNYNLPESKIRAFEKDWKFLVPIYSCWLIDFASYFYFLAMASKGYIEPNVWKFMLYAFCSAHAGALNLVIGHELVHRK